MDDPKYEKLHRLKGKLGVFRIPLGVFLLLVSVLFILTPFTPGSWLFLLAGLELLNLREKVYDRLRRKKPKGD